MSALTNKDVRVSVLHSGYFDGKVVIESEKYLLIRTEDGETIAFPWYSIGRIEIVRGK